MGCPIRRSVDQRLFAPSHSISQRTTSFIASYRQGIHQMPLSHLIALISNAHLCLPDRRIRRRMLRPGHTRRGGHCRKTRIFHQDRPGTLADLAISPSPSTLHTLRHAALSGVAGKASNPGVSPLHDVTERSTSGSACAETCSLTHGWTVP